MGEVCIFPKRKRKNAQFLLHKLHGFIDFSIILENDAYISTGFLDTQL